MIVDTRYGSVPIDAELDAILRQAAKDVVAESKKYPVYGPPDSAYTPNAPSAGLSTSTYIAIALIGVAVVLTVIGK